jgi:hypothetical protein
MNAILEQLIRTEFYIHQNLEYSLENQFDIIESYLDEEDKHRLKQDVKRFNTIGRFVIQNTFCGGILYLKVPERISRIELKVKDELDYIQALVEYESDERVNENIKYKTSFGKIEVENWDVNKIFPNFFKYSKDIQCGVLFLIGLLIKSLCEYGKDNLAHMKFMNNFQLKLTLEEGKREMNIPIEVQ